MKYCNLIKSTLSKANISNFIILKRKKIGTKKFVVQNFVNFLLCNKNKYFQHQFSNELNFNKTDVVKHALIETVENL